MNWKITHLETVNKIRKILCSKEPRLMGATSVFPAGNAKVSYRILKDGPRQVINNPNKNEMAIANCIKCLLQNL